MENGNKAPTAREIIEISLKELESINVPILYADAIARPIWIVSQRLRDVIAAIAEAEETKEPEEVKEDNV